MPYILRSNTAAEQPLNLTPQQLFESLGISPLPSPEQAEILNYPRILHLVSNGKITAETWQNMSPELASAYNGLGVWAVLEAGLISDTELLSLTQQQLETLNTKGAMNLLGIKIHSWDIDVGNYFSFSNGRVGLGVEFSSLNNKNEIPNILDDLLSMLPEQTINFEQDIAHPLVHLGICYPFEVSRFSVEEMEILSRPNIRGALIAHARPYDAPTGYREEVDNDPFYLTPYQAIELLNGTDSTIDPLPIYRLLSVECHPHSRLLITEAKYLISINFQKYLEDDRLLKMLLKRDITIGRLLNYKDNPEALKNIADNHEAIAKELITLEQAASLPSQQQVKIQHSLEDLKKEQRKEEIIKKSGRLIQAGSITKEQATELINLNPDFAEYIVDAGRRTKLAMILFPEIHLSFFPKVIEGLQLTKEQRWEILQNLCHAINNDSKIWKNLQTLQIPTPEHRAINAVEMEDLLTQRFLNIPPQPEYIPASFAEVLSNAPQPSIHTPSTNHYKNSM
ncbi:MAG: hypothetical protein ACOYK8_00535 [Alphaproteobacteria bacterium]